MKKGLKYSLAAVFAASALTPAIAFAAEENQTAEGVYNLETGKYLTFDQFQELTTSQKGKWLSSKDVVIVTGGQVYEGLNVITLGDDELVESGILIEDYPKEFPPIDVIDLTAYNAVLAAVEEADYTAESWAAYQEVVAANVVTAENTQEEVDAATAAIEAAQANLVAVELVVESVTAITTTMDVTGGQLEFAINGNTEAADVEALEEAGYSVKFVASGAATVDPATGAVSSITAGAKNFRYQVEVTDAEGEVVATSELVTVTVQDYYTTVTELNNVALSVGGNEVTVNTVSKHDAGIKVNAFGKTKASTGTEDVNLSSNAGVTFTSSKNAIATVDANGNVTLTGAVGEVTITAKAGNLTKSATFTVVADERKVDTTKSAVSATAIKDAEGAVVEFAVALKDQFGEVITGGASSIEFAKIDVVTSTITEDADNKGTYKVKATLDKKTATAQDVDVTYAGTKLSTIKVTVVEPGNVAAYEVSAESMKLDIFANEEPTTTLNVVGKDENGYTALTVSQADLADPTKYSVKTTDKTIVAFEEGKLVGKKVGTATVKVYSVDGSIEDYIGEVTIEVINSKPTLATATIASIAKQTDATKTIALADVVKVTLAGSGDYEDVEFTFTSNEVIAGEYGVVGNVYLTGTTAAEITEDGTIVFTAQEEAVEATTELTITDLKGNILAETSFILDIDEDEDEGEE
jgi:hypothetical protein